MKDMPLWWMVLSRGLDYGPSDADDETSRLVAEGIRREIIREPLMMSPLVARDNGGFDYSIGEFVIQIPFQSFWIEGAGESDMLWGGLCQAATDDSGRIVGMVIRSIYFFKDGDADRPRYSTAKYFDIDIDRGVLIGDYPTVDRDRLRISSHVITKCVQTLELLSCTNVAVAPRRQTDVAAVREATRRNGGHPAGYRYHVLVVRPPGARSDAPAQEIGNMPRHICRGHFAEYGPEFGKGLLFGKHAGRFYIPPHLKGDAKNGIVEKDYAIRTR